MRAILARTPFPSPTAFVSTTTSPLLPRLPATCRSSSLVRQSCYSTPVPFPWRPIASPAWPSCFSKSSWPSRPSLKNHTRKFALRSAGKYGVAMELQTTLKIACLQLACGTDKKANIQNAAAKIQAASQQGAEVIVLPECFNSPYGTKYFPEYAENVIEGQSETALMLSTAARDNKVFIVGGSFPEKEGEKIFNSCYIFNRDGDMVARHRKVLVHLFDIDIPGKITFKESDTLSPGDCPTIVDLSEHGGPPVRMGIGICYDIRFPELALLYRHLGCSMLVYPGAFNMVTGPAHWELLLRARAVDTQSFGIVCSPARDENADYIAWGHSMVVDPWGEKEKEDILMVDLDLTQVVSRRQNMPYWLQRRQDIYKLSSPFMPEKKPSSDK